MRRWIVAIALLLLLPPLALVWIAESGEVVVLESPRDGATWRLWVVDLAEGPFLRGNQGGAWVARVREDPAVRIQRGGTWQAFRAQPRPERREEVIAAMRAKYGVREAARRALRGDEGSVVFGLVPRPMALP